MSLSDDHLIKLYSDGKSCADIARLSQCSETTIYNRLIVLDVTMRNRSEANQIFPDLVFILLYNIGLSVSQIGRLLGVDASTATKRLHTINFPLRSRSVASQIRYTEEEFRYHFMTQDVSDRLMQLIDK